MKNILFKTLLIAAITSIFITGCGKEDNNNSYSDYSGQSNNDNSSISAPTGLRATIDEDNDILLTWNSVPNAVRYYVYHSTTSSGTFAYLGNTAETSCYITNPEAGYHYMKVSAISNNGDESRQSDYVYCYVNSNNGGNNGGNGGNNGGGNNGGSSVSRPAAPTGVSVSNEGNAAIPLVVVRWNEVSGATSYKVYKSTSASGSYSLCGTSNITAYVDDNAPTNGGTAYYKVTALNSAGESDKSNYAQYSSVSSADALAPGIRYGNCTVSGTTMTLRWEHLSTSEGFGRATSCKLRVWNPYAEEWQDTELSANATSTSFNFSTKIDNSGYVKAGIIVSNAQGSYTPGAKVYDTNSKRFLN